MFFFLFYEGGENDIGYAKDYTAAWRLMIKQKVPLVCYRSGSDEIVGANMNFIMSKDDHFMEKTMEQASFFYLCDNKSFLCEAKIYWFFFCLGEIKNHEKCAGRHFCDV